MTGTESLWPWLRCLPDRKVMNQTKVSKWLGLCCSGWPPHRDDIRHAIDYFFREWPWLESITVIYEDVEIEGRVRT